jgi:tetratricopeptide (TPR) repeat protein
LSSSRSLRPRILLAFPVLALFLAGLTARGELVEWLQNLEGNGRFEAVFFRTVTLLGAPVSVRRLPGEARNALNDLVSKSPNDAEVYRMRARADEAQLDFAAEEADWQKYTQLAGDKADAELQLADFYHRRLRPLDEVKALDAVTQAPPSPADKLRPSSQQRAWQAFERIFEVIRLQALPDTLALEQYTAWLARYPKAPAAYSRFFNFLVAGNHEAEESGSGIVQGQRDFSTSRLSTSRLPSEAEQLIRRYAKAFPRDTVFPIQARATLAFQRGSTDQALALYDRSFQPLWPPALVQNYFDLLKETHRLRDFLRRAHAAVAAHPSDVAAAARLFYYYQQQGNSGEALRALIEYRLRMEKSNAVWKGDQLWTLARLFDGAHAYNEAARGYYALYSLPGVEPALQEKALAGIANLLLTAPEEPIEFGSNSIAFLRDIGALDPYPGFWNGILSLLLNSQSPASQYSQAEGTATAYFHRARAAELVALFDERFPQSLERSELHARLLDAYAVYGMDEAILRASRQFLNSFPRAPQRVHVAMLMADSYARKDMVKEELALYDQLLAELAARAEHIPLGEPGSADTAMVEQPGATEQPEGVGPNSVRPPAVEQPGTTEQPEGEETGAGQASRALSVSPVPGGGAYRVGARRHTRRMFFPPGVRPAETQPGQPSGARSPEYSQVLERYISRLVALGRPLAVLELFRREMDHNPNDPGLYERLATFLDQNHMDDRIEVVYKKALQQFPDRSWYQKLARWYLRREERQQFEELTRQVIQTFSGTELEEYFQSVVSSGPVAPQLYVQLNLYARQRFPHNLTFVKNLLDAYRSRPTYNRQAWDALIRQYWFYDDTMRSVFFAYLSSGGELDSELQTVRASVLCKGALPCAPATLGAQSAAGNWTELTQANPAAAHFIAEAEIWRSHFESAAPVSKAIAESYPADFEMGRRASSLFRSLAPFNPQYTETAVSIEETLSKCSPGDRDLDIRIGDIYADREMFAKARPYWNRVPGLEPGNSDSFLESATVFWDYFLFGDALRVINEARQKFSNPALFAYQAGAVYEGRREFGRAVGEYLKGALSSAGDSASRARLLRLVKRPSLRPTIEQASAQAASGDNPDLNAVSLRIDVLGALNQRAALETFLTHLAQGTASLDLLAQIQPVAERYGFDNLRTLILERQIALLADPVEKLQLRLQLARFYESKDQLEQARALMESVHNENPLLLGVIRSSVDFYWRNKMWDPAIETLLAAAKSAYPELSRQFSLEAAGKAAEVKECARAREVLTALLQVEPYNADYLAALADTYAREGDDKSLRGFYLAKIQAFRDSNLSREEKTARIAALRRGLIPALVRLKDFAGAVDQYIEILNQYPEDDGLAQEAAAFADRNARRRQLLDYYAKASADSPKDFRWPMVLARIETYFEDYSAAIAAYTRARAVRPDRTDLLAAQAGLEERLMRFDDALKSYSRLYQLTFQNSAWMEKVAEVEAREDRADAAVAALAKALVEGRPEKPELYFAVADRLVGWNMLAQARPFAERGVALAGKDLLIRPENFNGALTYVTVLTRLGDYSTAYARLREAANALRDRKIEPNLIPFLSAMGSVVKEYYTPEQNAAFAGFLLKQKEGMEATDFNQTLIPLAQYAGLADLEAGWRYMVMMASPGSPEAQAMETRLAELQKQRMRFDEYGAQLEAYWKVFPSRPGKDSILQRAADSYGAAGNRVAELRVLQQAFEGQGFYGEPLRRYLDLLSMESPELLVTIAGGAHPDQVRDAAATTALETGKVDLALQAVAARGTRLPPVWTRAYTGLVGLYYSDRSPAINSAFQQALDTRTIGERVARPPDRDDTLAGNAWFYYGMRYGEYLSITQLGNAEDYLPAALEGTPASSDAYFTLADYYREAGQPGAALEDFAHVLELSSHRGDARDRRAQILWQQGKQDDAVKEWRLALEAFRAQEDSPTVPQDFWSDLLATLEHIGEAARTPGAGVRGLFPQLRDEADRVVRAYVRRNGSYRVDPILHGALAAAGDPAQGADWLVDLSGAAQSPVPFLSELVAAPWFPEGQKEPVYRRILALAQDEAAKTFGAEHSTALETLHYWQLGWIDFLLDNGRVADAQNALNDLPEDVRDPRQPEIASLMVRLAVQSNQLEELLQQFQQAPDKAPAPDVLRNIALSLEETVQDVASRPEGARVSRPDVAQAPGPDVARASRPLSRERPAPAAGRGQDTRPAGATGETSALESARRLLEYVYTAAIDAHDFAPANFLGLAEVRLQQGDLARAMALLERMNRVAGEPFGNLAAAGDLLVKMGHPAEAVEFYSLRVKAVPWDNDARLKLAQAEAAASRQRNGAIQLFAALASSPNAVYATRAAAAESLGDLKAPAASSGSAELEWLIRGGAVAGAESPGFYYARLRAAREAADPATKIRLLLDAIALRPEDSTPGFAASPPNATRPEGVSPRILLAQAAATANRNELAVSAITPLLDQSITIDQGRPSPSSRAGRRFRNSRQARMNEGEETGQPEHSDYMWKSFLASQELSVSQKSQLAAQLAGALAKLNRLAEAARLWKVASMLATDDSLRSGTSRELERVQAQLKLEQADQERRPVITNHLEQEGLVRPRLFKPGEPSIGGGAVARGAGRQEHHRPLASGERAAVRSGEFGGTLQ